MGNSTAMIEHYSIIRANDCSGELLDDDINSQILRSSKNDGVENRQ